MHVSWNGPHVLNIYSSIQLIVCSTVTFLLKSFGEWYTIGRIERPAYLVDTVFNIMIQLVTTLWDLCFETPLLLVSSSWLWILVVSHPTKTKCMPTIRTQSTKQWLIVRYIDMMSSQRLARHGQCQPDPHPRQHPPQQLGANTSSEGKQSRAIVCTLIQRKSLGSILWNAESVHWEKSELQTFVINKKITTRCSVSHAIIFRLFTEHRRLLAHVYQAPKRKWDISLNVHSSNL